MGEKIKTSGIPTSKKKSGMTQTKGRNPHHSWKKVFKLVIVIKKTIWAGWASREVDFLKKVIKKEKGRWEGVVQSLLRNDNYLCTLKSPAMEKRNQDFGKGRWETLKKGGKNLKKGHTGTLNRWGAFHDKWRD